MLRLQRPVLRSDLIYRRNFVISALFIALWALGFCLVWIGCSADSLNGTYISEDKGSLLESITFNKDGTGFIFFDGSKIEGTYRIEGNTITIGSQGIYIVFERKGDVLHLTEENVNSNRYFSVFLSETYRKFNSGGSTKSGESAKAKADVDKKLNGTWIREFEEEGVKYKSEATYNNGVYEIVFDDGSGSKGTYTTEKGKITTTLTHERQSRWVEVEPYSFIEDYTIKGNTLTFTSEDSESGEKYAVTYTKK